MTGLLPRLLALATLTPVAVLLFGWVEALVVWAPLSLAAGYGLTAFGRWRVRRDKLALRPQRTQLDVLTDAYADGRIDLETFERFAGLIVAGKSVGLPAVCWEPSTGPQSLANVHDIVKSVYVSDRLDRQLRT